LKAPGSRHLIARYRFGHVKQSIVHDTFPKMMQLCFPTVKYEINRSDWFATMPGGSELWFGGLDDRERTEKILGTEFATVFLNEASQIPFNSRNMVLTRLAQLVRDTVRKAPLPLKEYVDENPPDKAHWTYRLFRTKVNPDSRQELPDKDNYAFMQLNPRDNLENLSADYLKVLESLPARLRKRFLEGEFRDAAPNALFTDESIERWRHIDGELPDMLRVVVAVDPSGAEDEENLENDAIGIVVCGLGIDGNGYVLEDLTCKCSPEKWGKVATNAFERHAADRIVAEVNYGGAMVGAVIRAARPRTPFRPVTASRGKVVRAEPISTLFEQGKIRMAGVFREMEDELFSFTTMGYMGENSPNRADAMIWAMSDLMPELVKPVEELIAAPPQVVMRSRSATAWMRS